MKAVLPQVNIFRELSISVLLTITAFGVHALTKIGLLVSLESVLTVTLVVGYLLLSLTRHKIIRRWSVFFAMSIFAMALSVRYGFGASLLILGPMIVFLRSRAIGRSVSMSFVELALVMGGAHLAWSALHLGHPIWLALWIFLLVGAGHAFIPKNISLLRPKRSAIGGGSDLNGFEMSYRAAVQTLSQGRK